MDDFAQDFPDFLTDEEIMEILSFEEDMGIDLTSLDEDLYDEDDAEVEFGIY
jgi:uncharacterized protein YjgD (DUF1641 family)